jgi:hypothetical protein
VSCPTTSSCTGVGYYTDSSAETQAFYAQESSGTWGDATEIPNTAALNAGGAAEALSVSCATDTDCLIGGYYDDVSKAQQAFVDEEASGTWGNAVELDGSATLNAGGTAEVSAVECPAAGDCVAVGEVTDATPQQQAMVAVEDQGSWGAATIPAGSVALNVDGTALLDDVACTSSAECVAVGYYTDATNHLEPLVDQAVNLSFAPATGLPGASRLNVAGGDASLVDVSCAPTVGVCALAGSYTSGPTATQAMLADFTPPPSAIPASSARVSIAALHGTLWTVDAAHAHVIGLRETDGSVVRTDAIPGATEVLSDGAHLWVSSRSTATVTELSAAGAVLRRVHVGAGPTYLAAASGKVVVCDTAAQQFSVITEASGAVRTYATSHPVDVAVASGLAWVASSASRALAYSLTTGRLVRTVALPAAPTRLAAGPGGVLYATSAAHGWLLRIQGASASVVSRAAGAGAAGLVVADGVVWVASERAASLSAFTIPSSVPVVLAGVPSPLEPCVDGGFVFVATPAAHAIYEVAAYL